MALATRPKPSAHNRKRQAGHHRQSKHYLKAYWPYLPMLMIVVVGLAINSLWSNAGHVLGATSDFSTASLLDDTNHDRAEAHEAPLTLNTQLAEAAQIKANDMVEHNYWAHNSPTGQTPWSLISAAGYDYAEAGENLAYGFSDATSTIDGWMNSPQHRANILDNGYQNVGFGVASSPDFQGKGPVKIVVAEYASPVPAAANITFTVPKPSETVPLGHSPSTDLAAQPVSRIQLLTEGQAAWSTLLLSAIAGGAIVWLLLRHGRHWQRLLAQGESFLSHHPVLDILLVSVATCGVVLTRASGTIR